MIWTPYGPPATERLGEQIAESKNGDPLAPVTVVVPTNIAGLATRRALGTREQGVAAVNFLLIQDIAVQLMGERLQHQRLSDLFIGAAMRRALADSPGVFKDSANHTGTEQALIQAYRAVRELSESNLNLLAAQSKRADDLVRLCRHVRSELEEQWYDDRDLCDQVVDGLRSGSLGATVEELGAVIVYLPQRLSGSQGQMISALADTTSVVVIAGLTGIAPADASVWESVGRMEGSAEEASPSDTPHGQRIISVASADEEARIAVREAVNAARDGISFGRIAVLCGGGLSAVREVQSQLAAANIPFSGPSGRTLAETLVGRGILALLNLKPRGFRRDEVFALLSVARPSLPDDELAASSQWRAAPVMAWERISRRAGVSRGPDQWQDRLGQYAAQLYSDADTEQGDPDYLEERASRLRREAAYAESLAQFMATLVGDLSPDPAPTTWRRWCKWVERLINDYLGDETSREDWPETEEEAGKDIQRVLDRLAQLDEVEGNPPVASFLPTLTAELSNTTTGRTGQTGIGVFTGRIGEALGLELHRLVVTGLAEGTFPQYPSDDPLLPDEERKAAGGDIELVADLLGEQHRSFLTALAFAESTTLVYARGDSRRAAEQPASRWLLDTATVLAGHRVEGTSLEGLANQEWFEHVPSFSGRVLRAEFPANEQEFRLQALSLGHQDGEMPTDTTLARGKEMVVARSLNEFSRFDGNLADLDTSGLTNNIMSPTSLETWAACPMRYLFKHVLRVQSVEQPEELLEITPMEKGSLIHTALDRFMAEQLEAGLTPRPGQPWSSQQRDRLQEIGEEECDTAESKGLTGTPVYWRHDRKRILADLDRFLIEDSEMRQQRGTTPFASELAFGVPGSDQGSVEVRLSNEQTVRFRGRADRLDQGADNGLQVTDYKTGKAGDYKGVDEGSKDWDPVQRGTRLQLPVYGLAARELVHSPDAPVRAQYWFVTEQGDFETYGYLLDENVLSRFREVVGTIKDGIEAGVFCDRPEPGNAGGPFSQRCEYCNSDRLGTEDNRRKWERMSNEELLANYRNLVEPKDEVQSDEAV